MAENKIPNASLEEIARQRDEARQQAEAEAAQELLDRAERPETNQPEVDGRKAHEAAEAQRRAEWEEKKQAREDKIQFAWEEATSVPDDQLVANSVKRLGDMTERMTRRNMKICVTENIQTLCYEDIGFARLVMHPRKSMSNCFRYINRKALEYLKQEMADNAEKTTGVSTIGGDVPDELCYQWAEEYFRDLNAKEDQTEEDKEFVPKVYTGASTKSKKEPKKKADAPKKAKPAPKTVEAPPQIEEEQQSLFGEDVA